MGETEPTLLDEVLVYCRLHGVGEAEFGKMAVHSMHFVNSLRNGRVSRPKTIARVRAFIALGAPPHRSRGSGLHAKQVATVRRNAEVASVFRFSDPVEQAKTFIRQQRFHCFEAAITRPELHGNYFIGPNLVDRDGLLDFARRHGWKQGGDNGCAASG